jgi:uncharacterized membrane protein
MSLTIFVKANFWAGLVGTVVFTPVVYAYEAIFVGLGSPLLKFGWPDAFMIVVAPLLMGLGFSLTALMAFPFVRYLESLGVLSLGRPSQHGAGDV